MKAEMTDKERFHRALKRILPLKKDDLRKRLEAENQRLQVGKKRGSKPSASPPLSFPVSVRRIFVLPYQ